jgi:TonB family protein
MTETILAAVLRMNLAGAFVILLVLAARRPARRVFGAAAAYALWAVIPATIVAALLPRPMTATPIDAMVLSLIHQPAAAAPQRHAGLAPLVLGLWAAGALAVAALLLALQARYVNALGAIRSPAFERGAQVWRSGREGGGPLVVGVLSPRIVVPADFEARFDADERGLILAHERVHLARGDARINALAAGLQCLCWFNPLSHVAVRAMRMDQELACDAAVLSQRPASRRLYGALLLKTQLNASTLPLGCHWPSASAHPLRQRIVMLNAPAPGALRRRLGWAAVLSVGVLAGVGAWAAQPVSGGRLIAAPVWIARPTGADLARVYPLQAAASHMSGRAIVRCRVDAVGLLRSCAVSSEAPAGQGFGEATLRLTPQFRMAAKDSAEMRTRGGTVVIPVRFKAQF